MGSNGFMKRLITLLLAAFITLGLCACHNGNDPNRKEPEDGTGKNADGIHLVDNGSAVYRVIYPAATNACLSEALTALQDSVNQTHHIKFSTSSDTFASLGSSSAPEILLGATSYEESSAAFSELPDHAFSVSVKNGRVVIVASDDALYSTAVEHLLAACTVTGETMTLPADYSYVSKSYQAYPIVANNASQYKIVYDYTMEEGKALAEQLKEAILAATGVSLPVLSDAQSFEENYEILIGNTDRSFSHKNTCKFMDYGVAWDAQTSSIALTGTVESSVPHLATFIKALGKKGQLSLSEVLFGVFHNSEYGRIPALRDEYDALYVSELNSYYVLYYEGNPAEYAAYLTRLETQEGFTKYDSNEVNGNLFATYTDGETILSVCYQKYMGIIRVSADPVKISTLQPLTPENTVAVTTPQLTQFGHSCSYILRLADGRFIVLDGGLNRENVYNGLYEELCKQNVLEGKPVIASWIFTHAHSDHYGAFLGFAGKYSAFVTLENVLVGVPGYEVLAQNTEAQSDLEDVMLRLIQSLKESLNTYFPSTSITIPHSGQRMYYGDALLQVLYTHEDLSPTRLAATNCTSTVFTVTVAGQKLTFLGDAGEQSSYTIFRMYGNTLKTDFVQVAHHGLNGGNDAMYAAMAADFATWATSYKAFMEHPAKLWNFPRNHFDVHSVKENLMPADDNDVMVIPLPHLVGSVPEYVRTFPF